MRFLHLGVNGTLFAFIKLFTSIETNLFCQQNNVTNNNNGHLMIESYNFWLISLSAFISSLVFFYSCKFVTRIYESNPLERNQFLAIYSASMGCILFSIDNLNWVAIEPSLSSDHFSLPIFFGSLLVAMLAIYTVLSEASKKILTFNALLNKSFTTGLAGYVMFYLSFVSRHPEIPLTLNLVNLLLALLAATLLSAMIIVYFFKMKIANHNFSILVKAVMATTLGCLMVFLNPLFNATLSYEYQKTQTAVYLVNEREFIAVFISVAILSLFVITLVAPNFFEHLKTRFKKLNFSDGELDDVLDKDPLTKISNRSGFDAQLNYSIKRSTRAGKTIALAFIDLDHFKPVNDNFGHHVGDAVLIKIAQRLIQSVRACDFVARIGGDEFVAIIQDITYDEDITPIIERMVRSVGEPFHVNQFNIDISCSVGVAVYPGDGDIDKLMVSADAAMYKAKENGRNQFKFFDTDIESASDAMLTIQRELRHALENHEFELLFQPKVDCKTQQPIGAEALIRWKHPKKGIILPNDFLSIAERFGLMGSINAWVLDEVCKTIKRAKNLDIDLNISINLARQQLRNQHIVAEIQAIMKLYHVTASQIIFEIKETTAIKNEIQFMSILEDFKKAHLKVSIDDFGSHPFSLSYLQNLNVDELKLDRVFIKEMTDNKATHALVDAVIRLAHALDFNVVAEGVETEAQRVALANMGCNHMQGYLFSKPISEKKLTRLFKQLNHNFVSTGQYTVADYQL